MGDVFDEDDDRLMIDDAMAEPTVAAHSTRVGALAAPSPAVCDKAHPSASACDFVQHGALQGVESLKEEGEIDDEEECAGGAHSSHTFAGSSNLFQKTANWSGAPRNAGFYAALNGGGNYGYAGGLPLDRSLPFNTAGLSAHAPSLPSPSTPKKTLDASNVLTLEANEVCVGGPPGGTGIQLKGCAGGPDGARFDTSTGTLATSPQVKRVNDDDTEPALRVRSTTESVSDEFGTSSDPSTSVLPSNSRLRRKKRRASGGEDSDGVQLCVPSSNASQAMPLSAPTVATVADSVAKKKKLGVRDKSTCVSTRSVQTNDEEVDVRVGVNYCLDFCVLRKVSNYLYIVTNWNGRELYGILGDGLPPMDHAFMNKRVGGGSSVTEENGFDASSGSSNDRANGTPSKQRAVHKRSNRSSSVCPANGLPEKSSAKKGLALTVGRPASASTSELHSVGGVEGATEEEMSQSPVWWSGDTVFAVGSTPCATSSGLTLLKETSTVPMVTCAVAGCGYRFDTLAQVTYHRQSHFDKAASRAIYVESMGTQTEDVAKEVQHRDVGTLTDDLSRISGAAEPSTVSLGTQTELETNSGTILASSSQIGDSKLTTTEKQSISELFQVVASDVANSNRSSLLPKEEVTEAAKAPSKGFESAFPGVSSRPLDAMQKLVGEGVHTAARDPITTGLFAGGVSHAHAASVIAAGGIMIPSTSMSATAGASHTAAASPAFSDISDDAPTLEKEVAYKAEERTLEHVKMHTGVQSQPSLGPLGLGLTNEKLCAVSSSASELPSSSLSLSSLPSVSSARLSTEVVSTASSSGPICSDPGKKGDMRPLPSSVPSLNPFPPVTSLAGLEAAGYSSGMRPPPVGLHGGPGNPPGGAPTSAMLYSQPYMLFSMPNAMPSTNVGAALGPSKHKIHDLKATPPGISNTSKDSSLVRMSPSMVASPGARPLSGGPSGSLAGGTSGTSKQPGNQQSAGAGNAAGQRPPSCTAPFMAQPPTMPQAPGERGCSAAQAINLMQQQQQQQAHFMAQLQQHQHMQQFMQSQLRFGSSFAMPGTPTSAAVVAQAAYEQQLAAMQVASLGIFAPNPYPPK